MNSPSFNKLSKSRGIAEPFHGRGASDNPINRFEQIYFEKDALLEEVDTYERISPKTIFLREKTKSIIAYNDSPDVGMGASVNPYRGCEHGCIYCYARPTHEYLGFSSGLDFESKIMVKENAPVLLRKELSAKNWQPQVIGMSGITDCYQPAERYFKLTRQCLEVLAEFRNPVVIITKNFLVTRDIDVLQELAKYHAVVVCVSVTTLDGQLFRLMEPRACPPWRRLEAIKKLSQAGIPVGVNVAPVIPGLTDHQMPDIIKAAVEAGAQSAGYIPVRLLYAVKEIFEQWLGQHFPERKDKILNRIRAMRGGKLNDPNFNSRMEGKGVFAEQLADLFVIGCRRAGIKEHGVQLSTQAFRKVSLGQLVGAF